MKNNADAVSINEDTNGITVQITGHAYRNLKRLTKAQNRQLEETFTALEVVTTLLEPVIALRDAKDLVGIIRYNLCGEREDEVLGILANAAFEG